MFLRKTEAVCVQFCQKFDLFDRGDLQGGFHPVGGEAAACILIAVSGILDIAVDGCPSKLCVQSLKIPVD